MYTNALIVDDEPHIRRALRNALKEDFARIVEAATAEAALDLAAAHRPELIVLDLGLPDRPGQWVCAEVRRFADPFPVATLRYRTLQAHARQGLQ